MLHNCSLGIPRRFPAAFPGESREQLLSTYEIENITKYVGIKEKREFECA
jgi:hypothetical protein